MIDWDKYFVSLGLTFSNLEDRIEIMGKQPHTEFRKGQRVMVMLKNGGKIVGKYIGKHSKSIELDVGTFSTKSVRQVVIYKEQTVRNV